MSSTPALAESDLRDGEQSAENLYREHVLPIYGDVDDDLRQRFAGAFPRLWFYVRLGGLYELALNHAQVLDLGPGLTPFGALLQVLGARVTLVDDLGGGGCVTEENLVRAREILGKAERALGLRMVEMDLLTGGLPAHSDSVDAVTMFHCLEHFHHSPRHLMVEIRRVLRVGGTLVIGTPNAVNLRKRISVLTGKTNLPDLEEWYNEGTPFRGHVREPIVGELVRLCRWNGFAVVRIEGANFLGNDSTSLTTVPRFARPLARFVMAHLLPRWPALCSDIHVVARKEASQPGA